MGLVGVTGLGVAVIATIVGSTAGTAGTADGSTPVATVAANLAMARPAEPSRAAASPIGVPPPDVVVPATPTPALPTPRPPGAAPALVVGDSVALGSADALRAALGPATTIDAVVGRQFSEAPAIVGAWAAQHAGPIVLALGTNGAIREDDLDTVLTAAGPKRVVLMTVAVPRRWSLPNDDVVTRAAATHPATVRVADWAAVVARDPELLGPDHVHPNTAGRPLFAATLAAALAR